MDSLPLSHQRSPSIQFLTVTEVGLFVRHYALEKEMATHSSVLAWRIPGTGSLGGCCLWVAQSRTRLKRLSSSSSSNVAWKETSVMWITNGHPLYLRGRESTENGSSQIIHTFSLLFKQPYTVIGDKVTVPQCRIPL